MNNSETNVIGGFGGSMNGPTDNFHKITYGQNIERGQIRYAAEIEHNLNFVGKGRLFRPF